MEIGWERLEAKKNTDRNSQIIVMSAHSLYKICENPQALSMVKSVPRRNSR